MADTRGSSDARDFDTRLARTFVIVAEELSFTGAARRLGMTQQGVSTHIRRLESLLSCHLFERSHGHIHLTEQGSELLRHAQGVLLATDNMFAATKVENAPVRVAEIRGLRMMQDCWFSYRRTYPHQPVTFFDMLSREQTKALLEGHLDVGMGRVAAPIAGLSSAPLRLDPIMVMSVAEIGPTSLAQTPVGYTGGSSESYSDWVAFCQELATHTGVELIRVPHDNTMLEAIGQGQIGGDVPPVLAMAGMRDYPSAEFFHFNQLEDIQPYYPWRLLWRTHETRREVRDFLSTALSVSRDKGWLDLLDRDVDIWIPEDGTEHLAFSSR